MTLRVPVCPFGGRQGLFDGTEEKLSAVLLIFHLFPHDLSYTIFSSFPFSL